MVFHWNLSDSKSPLLFRTLLNNAVVWMVSAIIIIIIIIIIIFLFESFSHQRWPMVFYRSLSDNKSP